MMKAIVACLFFMVTTFVVSQNPFVDGIHELKTVDYKQEGNKYSMFGFKIILTDSCTAIYSCTQVITTSALIATNLATTTWRWKDITSLEIDSVNHILRLNGRDNMICSDKDLDTKEVSPCENNNVVNIYFKSNPSLRSAANWVLINIPLCNGKAMLIN